jgi:predicted membrane-bound mannosyltransferase
MTLIFSYLPYKTPWNILPFYLGWLILAGIGGAVILRRAKPFALKAVVILIFAALLYHLGLQNHRANFLYPADPRNPYVYAQTSPDFLKLIRRIENLAALHPEGKDLLIKVIADPDQQWPLPWSLRRFTRVGYWTEAAAPAELAKADLIIASSSQTEAIQKKLGDRFIFEYFGLRPDVLLTLFIPRKL